MHISTAQDLLIRSLCNVIPLSEALQEGLRKKFLFKKMAKGIRIKQADHTNRYLRFLVRGLVKAAYNTEGNEHILWFAQEGHFVLLPDSFFSQVPTDEYLETIEECEFFQLSFEDVESLFATFPEMERLARLTLQQKLVEAGRRARLLRLPSPQARLHHFIVANRQLAARLKRYEIAAYLNVNASTLSRSSTLSGLSI